MFVGAIVFGGLSRAVGEVYEVVSGGVSLEGGIIGKLVFLVEIVVV